MNQKMAFRIALTLITILFLYHPTQGLAVEEEKFYLFAGADSDYLGKLRGPNGFFVEIILQRPGSTASWETTLLGDISGEEYGIGIFLASFSSTNFRLEFIMERNGRETVLASDFVTADSKKQWI